MHRRTLTATSRSCGGPLLNTSTVLDDGSEDDLRGEGELDWFFAKLGQDLTDWELGEIFTSI